MKPPALPFDRVVLKTGGGTRHLTVSDFLTVPLVERVRALLEKRVEFYQHETRLDTNEALRALRERG